MNDIERLDLSGYRRQTCVYLFDSLSSPSMVYYLFKQKPEEPTNGTYIGWGGNFEEVDDGDVIECTIRELEEELGISLRRDEVFLQGVLIREDKGRAIYMLKAKYSKGLREGIVDNEGLGVYKSVNFHKEHPEFFLPNDIAFLDKLCFSDDEFKVFVDENGVVVEKS